MNPRKGFTMSTIIPSVILAAPLGTDSAALCTGIGAADGRLPLRRRLTIAAVLTTFEAGMPVVGVLLSGVIGDALGESARWIGGALLVALGFYMMRGGDDEETHAAPIGTAALVVAALAVSIDEVAVGVSLGLGGVNLPVLVGTIGTIVFTATMAGLTLGALLSDHAERAGRLAAWALVVLGVLLGVGVI
jgi:putative Mn2+ efflux pump MntP